MVLQREHSANIKAAPATYQRTDPPKTKNVLEFDCRGLEFVEFKADVRGGVAWICMDGD